MKTLQKILLAVLLLTPFSAFATIAAPWNATSTDKGYITPTTINSNNPDLFLQGNVGVGTTNPTLVNANARLTISGISSQDIIASTTDNTTLSDAIFNSYAPGSRIFMGGHGTNQTTLVYGITSGGWGELAAINSSFGTSNGLLFGTRTTATPIVFGTNSLERMRILSNGNVGVGSSSPFALFSIHASSTGAVASNMLFAIGSSTATATTTLFSISNTGAITTNLSGSGFVKTTGAGSALSVDTNTYLTGNQTITLSGVVTGSGSTAITTAFGSQTAGVLGSAITGNTSVLATSTLYGNGTGGTVLTWNNGVPQWIATTTFNSPLTFSGGAVSCATCSTFGYPFALNGNSTSSPIMLLASTTIGAGGQKTGLSISGGSTTTLIAYFASNVGVGTTTPIGNISVSGGLTGTPELYLATAQGQNAEFWLCQTLQSCMKQKAQDNQIRFTYNNPILWDFGDTGITRAALTTAGNFGIASSTPFAHLSVQNLYGDLTTTPIFQVASSTSSALDGSAGATPLFSVFPNANPAFLLGTTTPTVTSATSTIYMQKLQWQGGDAAGVTRCVFINAAGTMTVISGPCN